MELERNEKQPQSYGTLAEFIGANQKILSTLAIFVALSAFANNLPDKDVAKFLSFLLLTLALLIWAEIIANFRRASDQWRLYWFWEILTLAMFTFIYAWVKAYAGFLITAIALTVMAFCSLLVFALLKIGVRKIIRATTWRHRMGDQWTQETVPTFGAMFLVVIGFVLLSQFSLIKAYWLGLFRGP
jgi:hypothetical protein